MTVVWRTVAIVVGVAAVGCAVWFVRESRARRTAAIVTAAVPATPSLAGWPAGYAARVEAASAAARHLVRPTAALRELAGLYHANGYFRQARQVEEGLHRLEPHEVGWLNFLADAAQNVGDMAAAQSYLRQALALAPWDQVRRLKLADLLLKQGDNAAAEIEYRRRLEVQPSDPYARIGVARIALLRGDKEAARRELETVTRETPEFAGAHNLLAELYATMGDAAKAKAERVLGSQAARFREAGDPWLAKLDAWTFDPLRTQAAGVTTLQRQQAQVALLLYRDLVEHAPTEVAAYRALAAIYTQLGWMPSPGAAPATATDSDQMARGKAVYLTVCFACHQPHGEGLPTVFPPLARSDFLRADKDRAIRAVVNGLSGPIVVNGATYNNIMPPQTAQLSAAQLADVLTFVMSSWGNNLGAVSTEQVADAKTH